MTNTPKLNGAGCHFSVKSTSISGWGKLVLNGTDQTSEADTETGMDSEGYVITEVTYNHRETANLQTWVSGSGGTFQESIALSDYGQPGDTITITDTVNATISGSWIVSSGPSLTRGNTSIARINVPLHRYAKMTLS